MFSNLRVIYVSLRPCMEQVSIASLYCLLVWDSSTFSLKAMLLHISNTLVQVADDIYVKEPQKNLQFLLECMLFNT